MPIFMFFYDLSFAHASRQGKVPLVSSHGLHQLHIFIFFLAVFHVAYSAITMALGRAKVSRYWPPLKLVTQNS